MKKTTVDDLIGQPCRYCGSEVNEKSESSLTHAYWDFGMNGIDSCVFICHKSCKVDGMKREAFECQLIDADCNDCRNYKRGKIAPKTISSYLNNQNGKLVTTIHQPDVYVGGHCLKFDRPTLAFPNKWTGRECFEHRRASL